MLYNILWLLLAITPVIILGYYVYLKDKDKEPKRILFKLFIGGILAAITTILVSLIIQRCFPTFIANALKDNGLKLFIYTFIVIGLTEELSKWLFLYLFSYHNKEFNQLYDMLVYSVFVALGFAIVENILYVYDGGFIVAISRFFVAIPGHVSMAIFMGYYLSFAKLATIKNRQDLKTQYFICSILVPSILHGIYDYCILSSNIILLLIFVVFILSLFYQAHKKLIWMSKLPDDFVIKQ